MSASTAVEVTAGGRLRQLPDGAEVDVVDRGLLTEEQYSSAARTTYAYRATEYGNAQRLVALFGEDLRWVDEERLWHVWNGSHWAPDTNGELMRRAKTVARLLWFETPHVDFPERVKRNLHAKSSETRRSLDAVIALAATEKRVTNDGTSYTITCSAADFDIDREALNCPNGTLDLTTGELRPHRRNDMHRRVTLVDYDPTARSAEWERFLRNSTGDDAELVDYLQLLAGATLLGTNRHDLVPIIFGPPGSGKSTFIQALLAPLGLRYADTASLETFAERKATSAAREDLARLEGLRMVACVEGERNHVMAAGLMKKVSGGDVIVARRLYENSRTWIPEMTVWIAVNERPQIHRDEEGMFRRVKAIPFENQVVDIDPTLRERLSDPNITGPAVLAWAVAGALRLSALEGALVDPPIVQEAIEEYQAEQAPTNLDAWLNECCVRVEDSTKTPTQTLRTSYEEWCHRHGRIADSTKAWATDMGRSFKRARTGSTRFYRGVEVH